MPRALLALTLLAAACAATSPPPPARPAPAATRAAATSPTPPAPPRSPPPPPRIPPATPAAATPATARPPANSPAKWPAIPTQRALLERGFIVRGESRPRRRDARALQRGPLVLRRPQREHRRGQAHPQVRRRRRSRPRSPTPTSRPGRRVERRPPRPDRQRAPRPGARSSPSRAPASSPSTCAATPRSSAPTYDLEIRCILGCERETTRFPVIVLVHGWTGFESIGPLTYFYNVARMIEQLGYPFAVAVLDPYNSTDVRAGQLAEQIDEALIDSGAPASSTSSATARAASTAATPSSATLRLRRPRLRPDDDRQPAPRHLRHRPRARPRPRPRRGRRRPAPQLPRRRHGPAKVRRQGLVLLAQRAAHAGGVQPRNPDDPRVKYISYTGRTCARPTSSTPRTSARTSSTP
jgi:hypothetical protein